MNKQNFESKDKFPLSTESLSFMQDMIGAAAGLARIGGENYILSGCEKSGSTVTPGVIVINGEVMPFKGGVENEKITVIEEREDVAANGLTFEQARVKRYAMFATGTGANYLPWANFKPLQTNEQLEKAKATVTYVDDEIKKIQSGSIPVGVIVMWSGSVSEIPDGWQLCDYSTIKGTDKRTPDLRGRFIVGYNVDDPDYNVVSDNPNQAKKGGAKTVTLTPNQMPSHAHSYDNFYYAEDGIPANATLGAGIKRFDTNDMATIGVKSGWDNRNSSFFSKDWNTRNAGGTEAHENRPPYYVLAYIIKL